MIEPYLSFFLSTTVFRVGLLAFVRRCERPFLNLLKDSLRDFLNDFRREIGVSPAPERSVKILRLVIFIPSIDIPEKIKKRQKYSFVLL